MATSSTTVAAAADDDWETCDLDRLRLNDTSSIPGAPESVRRQIVSRPPPAAVEPQDDSLDFDDPQGTSSYRSSGLSSAGAIAVTTVEHDAPFDPALTAALDNARERVTVLKFEDQILTFMKSAATKQLEFPPLSSYHRLIVHRLAQRFHLEHQAVETWGQPNEQRSVILIKTAESLVPRVMLIDLVSERRAETAAPKPGLKLMRRERPGDGKGKGGSGPGGGTPEGGKGAGSNKSVSEREREYAEARARIFGTKSGNTDEQRDNSSSEASIKRQSPGGPSPSSSVGAANGTPGRDNGSSSSSSSSNSQSRSQGSGDTPVRPEDQQGARRGGKALWEQGQSPGGGLPQSQGSSSSRSSSGGSPGDQQQRGEGPMETRRVAAVNAREWVDQRKVTWRNREAELSDPDFVRNRNAYRSSSAPNSVVSSAPYPAYSMQGMPPQQQQQQMVMPAPPPHGYMMGPLPAQMGYVGQPSYYAPPMPIDYSRLPPGSMPMGPYGGYPGGVIPPNAGGYAVRRASPPPPPPNHQGQAPPSTEYNSAFPPLG